MKRLLLAILTLLTLPSLIRAQGGTTTVTAIVKDPTGALYTSSQVNITFFDPGTPGKQPLLNGSVFQTTYTIFATDSFGRFTVQLPDNGIIDSSSGTVNTQWSFRIIFSDRQISFVYKTPINCAANIPTTCSGNTIDITAQLQAVAATLPSSGSSGPASATIPMSTLGFTAIPSFAATANAGYQMTLTGNVTSSTITGTPVNGNLLAFNFIQDATGGRTVAFPGNFIIPSGFSLDTAPNHPTYLLWKYDGTNWTLAVNIGGVGGGTAPQPPINSLQIDNGGVLGGSQFIYTPNETSGTNCNTQSCSDLSNFIDSGFGLFSTDGKNYVSLAAQSDVAPPGGVTQAGAQIAVGSTITHGPVTNGILLQTSIGGNASGGGCYISGAGTPPCAVGIYNLFGDVAGDTFNGQDASGFIAAISMEKSAGHNLNSVSGFQIQTPAKYTGGKGPTVETAVNLWGLEVQDLQGLGTTQTIGVHIEAQTNPSSHSFAIKTETNAGPSQLTDKVLSNNFSSLSANPSTSGAFNMATADPLCWRNAANSGDVCLAKNGAAIGNAPADYIKLGSGFFEGILLSTGGDTQIATSGQIRLISADPICWRNNANNANLCLSKNTSDNLIWPNNLSINGTLLVGGTGGQATFSNVTGTVAELSAFTSNGIPYGNGSNGLLNISAAGGAGTLCFVETNGGAPTWSGCGGSSSTSWSALTNPSADLSLVMGANNSLFTSGVITGARHAWEFTDGNSTSTGSFFNFHTGTTSTLKPFTLTAQGTANGVQMSTAGVLAPIGTGHISADQFTGLATVPVGGTGDTTLAANQLLAGNGTSPIQSIAGSTTGSNPILKLQPSSAANTALILDTAASPTGDVLDLNINAVKTSWFDASGILHTPQATYTGAGPLTLSGAEGTCGATSVGNDIICLGDSATHDAQLSVNGGTFKPLPQVANGSPTAHGLALWSVTFPQLNTTGAGTAGNIFISGGASADGAFGQLDLANANSHTGILGTSFGGTGSASLAAANIVTVTGAITVGHCASYSATTVIQDSGGTCGGAGGAPPLHTITAATAGNTINSTTFGQVWNWAPTGSQTNMKIGENTAATGANNINLQATTLSGSTAVPFQADNNGNGYRLGSTGLWQPVGTGTLATPGAAHNLVVSQAGSASVTYVPPVAAGKVLIDNGPGNDPTFQDPVISYNFPAESTAAWTSATSNNTTLAVNLVTGTSSNSSVVVTLNQGTTITGGAVNFEVSDTTAFTNAYNAPCWQPTTGATVISYTLIASTNQAFVCNVASYAAFRVRLSPVITGSGTVNVGVQPSAGPTQPFVTAQQSSGANLHVNVDSVPANASTNVTQFGGTNVSTGTGAGGAGIPRVTISNDSSLAANQSVNVAQINGVTPLMGNGTTGTGSQRVTIASDNTAFSVNASDVGTLADDGAAAGTNRLPTLPAIEQSQLPAAGTAGRNRALRTDLNGTTYTGTMPINITTYTANKLGLASVASATDIAVLPGNATNTVIVTRVQVSCTQTTAGIIDLQLIKRSTADTAGTSAGMTAVPLDSGNAAAVSAPLTYTANPTTGTAVGNVDSVKLACLAPATAGAADIYVWKPGMGQSIVLRGTAQQLAVNLNGVTVTGGNFNITLSWIETTGL